jgi:hypothetical protein
VWPAYDRAAVQIGGSRIQAYPNQHAAADASVKVMTAYMVVSPYDQGLGLVSGRFSGTRRSPRPWLVPISGYAVHHKEHHCLEMLKDLLKIHGPEQPG